MGGQRHRPPPAQAVDREHQDVYVPPRMDPQNPALDAPLPNPAAGHLVAGGVPQRLLNARAGTHGVSGNRAQVSDQRRARRELASRFQIVEDSYAGPRLPNQISQAEFDRVAREYSDIRLGSTDLRLDTAGIASRREQQAFRAGMMDDIADMLQTGSGRELIHALAHNADHHTTTLHRGDPHDQHEEPEGTLAEQTTPHVGVNTHVYLRPGESYRRLNDEMMRSDMVAFHEMTHALHETRGTSDAAEWRTEDGERRTRREPQATGLLEHHDDPITERAYRAERLQLGLHGMGLPGDERMRPRDQYRPTRVHRPGGLDVPNEPVG
jgi:hypothetical protein